MFSVAGPKAWNSLPKNKNNIVTKNTHCATNKFSVFLLLGCRVSDTSVSCDVLRLVMFLPLFLHVLFSRCTNAGFQIKKIKIKVTEYDKIRIQQLKYDSLVTQVNKINSTLNIIKVYV